MEFGLERVHVARYELILRLDGALWLTIIFRPLLTPKRANNASFGQWEAHHQNPLYQQKARAHLGAARHSTGRGVPVRGVDTSFTTLVIVQFIEK